MNHDDIERDNVVDRYVMGQLAPAEAEAFEEHYLGCQACLDQIELTEKLREVAREAAALEGFPAAPVARAAPSPAPAKVLPFRRAAPWLGVLAVAALLALAFGLQSWWRPAPGGEGGLVVELASTRGAGATPSVRIGAAALKGATFALELGLADAESFRVVLLQAGGQRLWEKGGLEPSGTTLRVDLPSGLRLAPGDYRFEVAAEGDGRPIGAFPFLVAP